MIKTMGKELFVSLVILFLMFCILSWIVIQVPDNTLDQSILIGFQNLHHANLTVVAKTLAVVGGLPLTVIFASCLWVYGYLKKDRFICYFVLLGSVLTVSSIWICKWIFARARPFWDLPVVETYGSSYPSAHGAYAMMMACILLYVSHTIRYRFLVVGFAVFWCLAMGLSRIYVGAHFFTDVLAGWIWAGLTMLLVKMSLDSYQLNNRLETL